MRISVVVATRNRPEALRAALDALAGAVRPDDEIVVVDSASTAPGVDAVADRAGVRYVRCDVPGASRARNAGIAASTADIVAFTDDDCRPQPGWGRALADAFERDDAVAFVTGRVVGEDGDEQMSTNDVPAGTWRGPLDPMRLGHGANWACRRSALATVGGFDEIMGPGGPLRAAEDHDLYWRLLDAGFTGRHVHEAVVVHPAWRRGVELLRTEWAYGVGTGALAMKARRLGRPGPALRTRVWDEGFALAAKLAWRRWERPALRQATRAAGAVAGALRARHVAIGDDRRFTVT
jgi:GT2 family glycosyltransferase